MTDSAVIERLDLLVATLRLANSEAIEDAANALRRDEVTREVLDKTADGWVSAGELVTAVSAETKANARTVRRRISSLLEMRLIMKDGAGNSVRYRSAGLV